MTTTYSFDKANRTNTLSMQRQAVAIIHSFFTKHQSLVGNPVFTVSSDKVVVQLFYFTSSVTPSGEQGLGNLSGASVAGLGEALTHC